LALDHPPAVVREAAAVLRKRPAVRPHDSDHGPGSRGVAEVALSCRDLEAGREALDIPLERARERLVEVVGVEDEVAFRRREAAEIGEVRVARELRLVG